MNGLSYANVSQDKINQLRAGLIAHGSNALDQGNGIFIITGHGIKATAVYVAATEILTITVNSKPFYVSEAMIESGINDALGIQPVAPDAPVVMVPKPEEE